MKKDWIFPEIKENKNIIETILERRGITGKDAVEEFLSEKPQLTYDPFLLKDMEEGAQKILSAISEEKRICIYGDYDADGVCAVSLLLEIMKKLSANVSYYIPSRFIDGYGLNIEAIKTIRDKGADLIVTVDCGSVSFAEIEYAKESGLDIIVTDHHNLDHKAASCLLINPRQESCRYPEKELSGCGVAFKLAQALQRKAGAEYLTKKDLNRVLDLVAIATVGDIVPLIGENRTFVKYGIKMINKGIRPGLKKLIEGAGLITGEINSYNIAYVIVPHLNAAGRLLSADTAVTLLTSDDDEVLAKAAELLIQNNKERRRIQEETFEKAVSIIEEKHMDDLFLIVDAPDAHEGISGIAAGKIKDRYHRPSILVTAAGEDKLKGSGRSIEGINLYEMLSACRHLFEKFGGHAGACGFLMHRDNLQALRKALRASAESLYLSDPTIFRPKIIIDCEIKPSQLDLQLVRTLEMLEPFGHKNPRPVFCLRRIILSTPVYIGDNRQHVRFNVSGLQCILFNRSPEYRDLFEQQKMVDLVGFPEINRWNGYEKIQFVAIDIRCYN